ncbi:MAG: hypothetical protein INQ03_06890 [Candidatus Heimdallarchaeota archaeon]|nr:hypothetical protein [Candidatus Heimdallarchaeota archaeon]
MYRQGDVLLRRSNPPRRLRVKEDNIALMGETTGHAHRIVTGQVYTQRWWGSLFVKAKKGTRLVHEEHGPIAIPPGWYEVIRQREYDPVRIRLVED